MRLKDPASYGRGPKRFLAYWIRDLASGLDSRGLRSLVPVTLIVCGAVGAAVGIGAVQAFWDNLQNTIAFYAAILAVNAILLAVCWAAFSRMLDTIGDPEFGSWMRLHGVDGLYGFYIEYIQLMQAIAVGAAAVGLVVSIIDAPAWLHRAVLGGTVGASLYAARWAQGCVRLMQELNDHKATFRDSNSGVTSINRSASRPAGN